MLFTLIPWTPSKYWNGFSPPYLPKLFTIPILRLRLETVKLLTTINNRAIALINESPSIYSFVKRFKKNCSDEFLRSVLTSYIMALMIDQFLWKSDAVKEKAALASMLCDVLLEKEDFQILHQWEKEGGELPEHIRTHPSSPGRLT